MSLWMPWWNAIWLLRPAFSRLRTFLWFATAVAGFTVRTELLGVTSIVRALKLQARFYTKLLDHFHSTAVQLDRLAALWTRAVLRLFPEPLRVNGRWVAGRRRHQGAQVRQEDARRQTAASAVGLEHQTRIHHGTLPAGSQPAGAGRRRVSSPCRSPSASTRAWCGPIATGAPCSTRCSPCSASSPSQNPCYFVADAYYAARKIVNGLLEQNNHLVTRVKSNAVAYTAHQQRGPRKRGRPRVYGSKVKLKSLLNDPTGHANRPTVPSTASTTSSSSIGSATCCGVRPAGSCASWP